MLKRGTSLYQTLRGSQLTCSAAIAFAVTLGACGGGSGSSEHGADMPAVAAPEQYFGAIAESEFSADIALPSIEQFNAAYDGITAQQPSLATNNSALSRVLFDRLKATTVPAIAVANPEHLLTMREYKLSMSDASRAYLAFSAVPIAEETVRSRLGCDSASGFVDGKADAVRHAYWSALMSKRVGAVLAIAIGVAHESGSTSLSSLMDLHNDLVGVDLARRNPGASDELLFRLVASQKAFYVDGNTVNSADSDALVFIAQRREFDVAMRGDLETAGRAADSVMFYFAQCDSKVRGTMVWQRDSWLDVRRFEGAFDADGKLDLVVDDAYQFENIDRNLRCNDVFVRLSGSSQRLTGSWTSSNCVDGGRLSLQRQ